MAKFNYVLYEDPMANLGSFKDELGKLYPHSSIIYVSSKNYYDALKLKDTSPLLTRNWLIYLNSRLSYAQCAKFFNDDSENVVVLDAKYSKRNEIVVELGAMGIDYKVVDNIKVSKERLINYCMEDLKISETNAKTICSKSNYYLPYVVEAVNILKSLGRPVERKDILKFVETRNSIRPIDILYHITGFKVRKLEQISTYLYDFRYAFSYIKTSILEALDSCLYVYHLMSEGYIGLDNYSGYDYGSYKMKLHDYHIKNIITDIHPRVSFESLVTIRKQISDCKGMYQFLYLVSSYTK